MYKSGFQDLKVWQISKDLAVEIYQLCSSSSQLKKDLGKRIDLLEENERMTVTDIYIKLRLEQSVASQHLAILRRAGVVSTERQGKFIFYSLDKDRLSQISKLVEELAA